MRNCVMIATGLLVAGTLLLGVLWAADMLPRVGGSEPALITLSLIRADALPSGVSPVRISLEDAAAFPPAFQEGLRNITTRDTAIVTLTEQMHQEVRRELQEMATRQGTTPAHFQYEGTLFRIAETGP